jgi:hypothetical protein
MQSLRIGILGAARIAELAIVKPAQATGTRLVAVAARDPQRAAAFAAAHGVERVANSYADLLADPQIEACNVQKPGRATQPGSTRSRVHRGSCGDVPAADPAQ